MNALKWLIVVLLFVAFSNIYAASPKNKIRYSIGGKDIIIPLPKSYFGGAQVAKGQGCLDFLPEGCKPLAGYHPFYQRVNGEVPVDISSCARVYIDTADEKKSYTLKEFKKLEEEYTAGMFQLSMPMEIDKILYEQGRKKDIETGKEVVFGVFFTRDNAFGTVRVFNQAGAPWGDTWGVWGKQSREYRNAKVVCTVIALINTRVVSLNMYCGYNEASSVKRLMERTRAWADNVLEVNKRLE